LFPLPQISAPLCGEVLSQGQPPAAQGTKTPNCITAQNRELLRMKAFDAIQQRALLSLRAADSRVFLRVMDVWGRFSTRHAES